VINTHSLLKDIRIGLHSATGGSSSNASSLGQKDTDSTSFLSWIPKILRRDSVPYGQPAMAPAPAAPTCRLNSQSGDHTSSCAPDTSVKSVKKSTLTPSFHLLRPTIKKLCNIQWIRDITSSRYQPTPTLLGKYSTTSASKLE
jgi:hypothetical protein